MLSAAQVTSTPRPSFRRAPAHARNTSCRISLSGIIGQLLTNKDKSELKLKTEDEAEKTATLTLPTQGPAKESQHGPCYYMRDGPLATATQQKAYLDSRSNVVTQHFEGAVGIDDFMSRVETSLFRRGFTGQNTIAMSNLCRDEVCNCMRSKIEHIFGSAFTSSSLGAVPTLGATGITAGISHSPNCIYSQKERYVFFSFAHIAIDKDGTIGAISRPGRTSMSCACGAMIGALGQIKADGVEHSCSTPGNHDMYDPEFSILKQRMARRMKAEGKSADMDLVEFTKLADREITDNMEELIGMTVDTSKADYAMITGVQVHSWSTDFHDEEPNLEFVWNSKAYCVVDGLRSELNLDEVPNLTPRQVRMIMTMEGKRNPEHTTVGSL